MGNREWGMVLFYYLFPVTYYLIYTNIFCNKPFLRCFERLFIKSRAGRQRFNLLGALNAVTHELITVTNDSYINARSVCELLHKISALGLTIPITLVLDNARYQKCAFLLHSHPKNRHYKVNNWRAQLRWARQLFNPKGVII